MTIALWHSFVVAAMAAVSTCSGCGGDTQLAVRYASGYSPPSGSLSVFGVFENGRLSAEAWKEIGPILSPSFSQHVCETAWNEGFMSENPNLAAAIDDYTRDDGVSDELLALLAPLAKGNSIMTLTVVGHKPALGAEDQAKSGGARMASPVPMSATMGAGARGMGGSGRGMRGGGRQPTSMPTEPDNNGARAYTISALLYSVQQRRAVVLVSMSYTGTDIDTALKQFTTKLHETIANVPCTGWNSDAKVDADKVRALMVQPAQSVTVD